MTLTRLLLLLALTGATWWLLRDDAIQHAPGVLVDEAPLQTPADDVAPFAFRGYTVEPLARFALQARVLGREDYQWDRESELSPSDLALGWGPMSDGRVLAEIEVSQSGRWYRWSAGRLPIAAGEIVRHSANMHMIPADDIVAGILDEVREGSIIELRGYLVEARAPDGWRWRSSLSREDSGARSCELVFVQRARLVRRSGRR